MNSLQPWGGWTAPSQPAQVLAQVYKYDQLNRLKQAQGVEGLTVAANSWEGVTDAVADRYKSAYTYDANGNIKTPQRHDENGQQYDDFTYQYHTAGGQLLQNRLYDLYDGATHTTGADIVAPSGTFDNSTTGVNQNNNYSYDELGNLIADKREEIGSIHWTVAGKVKRIARTPGSTKPELVFAYGADGQRIMKQVGEPANGGYKEYYIRDAQGNIMATYRYTISSSAGASLKLTERPIYGSSRIGSHTQELEMVGSTPPWYYPYTQPMPAPKKRYELTDHLGNVSTVVTGKLLPMAGGGYQADVVSAQSYEPFGSLLPGRNYSSGSYRFGFQGQEKDDEVYGATGTSYAYTYRMHDARVGRFLSVDPLAAKYPFYSPYAFSGNRVIDAIELEGLEPVMLPGLGLGNHVLPLLSNVRPVTSLREYGENVSQIGDKATVSSLPLVLANPVLAETVASAGQTASVIGTLLQIGADVKDGNYTAASTRAGLAVASYVLGSASKKGVQEAGLPEPNTTFLNISIDILLGKAEEAGMSTFGESGTATESTTPAAASPVVPTRTTGTDLLAP